MRATLDRERLLADLHAAVDEAAVPWPESTAFDRGVRRGMSRAWAITASGIEDGEYDLAEEAR